MKIKSPHKQIIDLKKRLILKNQKNNKFFFNKQKYYKIIIAVLIIFIIYPTTYKFENKKNSNNKEKINNYNITIINDTKEDLIENKFNDFYEININVLNSLYSFKKKYFKIENISITISDKFQMSKLEYDFGIYDEEKNLIYPSDFTLFNGLHMSCYLEVNNNGNISNIYSLPDIYHNQFYRCIEFFKNNEKIKFGFRIFIKENSVIFEEKIFSIDEFNDYILINKNETIFDPFFVNHEYDILVIKTNDVVLKKKFRLTRLYMQPPICNLKRNILTNNSEWEFKNIFNYYFCFCVGLNCLKNHLSQLTKSFSYMNIIDHNRDIYPKTDYIFVDFIFNDLSSDDTYPVFEKMKKLNYPVHYITEKKEIIEKYCDDINNCSTIIKVNSDNYHYYADFLEKYLTLLLKTKSVISCKESSFHSLSYLFYRIEYITYIAVGHGVCYFKDYLFNTTRIYGCFRNNKILIPPSQKLIEIPKRFSWRDEDIIKINLPRWDKYIYDDNKTDEMEENYDGKHISKNSILVMFTWRKAKWELNKDISPYYHENIIKILENRLLNEELERKNVTLYFSFHRYVGKRHKNQYKEVIDKYKNLELIDQNDISHCLARSSLVISDFSSIIFDFIYREKPFIIFVPDAKDPEIKSTYEEDYSNLIEDMNQRKYHLENHFFTVRETVDKMIYYINNGFSLDIKMKEFYKTFGLKKGNNIDTFIDYLKKLP